MSQRDTAECRILPLTVALDCPILPLAMKTTTQSSPRLPYKGILERGPDQSYNGRAIRLDIAGLGGAIHLGWEGDYMADAPDAYAEHVIAACNGRASDQARIEALTKALVSACVIIENEYPKGHACMDVARKGRAVLKGSS